MKKLSDILSGQIVTFDESHELIRFDPVALEANLESKEESI